MMSLPSRLLQAGVIVLAIAFPWVADAVSIVLDVKVSAVYQSPFADIKVHVVNRGDEIARQVEPSAVIGGQLVRFDPRDVRPNGQAQVFQSRAKIATPLAPGEHAVRVFVNYLDSATNAYNAPAYGVLRTGNANPLPIRATVPDVVVEQAASLSVVITNDSTSPLRLTVTPHTTPLVTINPARCDLSVDGGASTSAIFHIESSHRSGGSTWPLIVFIERQSAGQASLLTCRSRLHLSQKNLFPEADKSTSPFRYRRLSVLMVSAIYAATIFVTWLVLRRSRKKCGKTPF